MSSKLIHTLCFWWVFPSSWVIKYSVWSWYRWNMSAAIKPDLWNVAWQKLKSHVTFSIYASEKVLSVIPMVTRCCFLSQRKRRAKWNVTCNVTAQITPCDYIWQCLQCNRILQVCAMKGEVWSDTPQKKKGFILCLSCVFFFVLVFGQQWSSKALRNNQVLD